MMRRATSKKPLPMTAVVLAGGRATRLGGVDKGLVTVRGVPLIAHVLERLEPQVQRLLINANRHHQEYESFGWPIVDDGNDEYQGPLAGMASALRACNDEWLLTTPCDSPFPALDYASRMHAGALASNQKIAVASDGRRLQPVFCLLASDLIDSLSAYLAAGERKIDLWFERHGYHEVDFSDQPNMFLNINTPEECQRIDQQWPLLAN